MNPKLSCDEILLRDLKKARIRIFKAAMAEVLEEIEDEGLRDRAIWLLQGTVEYLQRQIKKLTPMLKGEMNGSEH